MRDEMIFLSAADDTRVLPTSSELLDVHAAMFRRKVQGAAEMPPKLEIHPRNDSFLHVMPAGVPSMSDVVIQRVSAYPGNASLELAELVSGGCRGRTDFAQRAFACNLGISSTTISAFFPL